MIKYAISVVGLALGFLLIFTQSHAQQPTRVPRVGFVHAGPGGPPAQFVEAFRQGLRALGYVEGQNVEVEFRWHPPERLDLLPGIAHELVRSNADVLVGSTTPEIIALKQATSTIPIVMITPSDPVGAGLIGSLARPGGNVTGLAWMSRDITGKRLELLKEAVPKASRVADLWDPRNPALQVDFQEMQRAARTLGIKIHSAEVRDPNELVSAFSSIKRAHVDALIVQAGYLTMSHRKQIADLAVQHGLPSMFFAREYVDAGGLMSYGGSLSDLYRRSAYYVDRILKGARPADLPVEQPTKFQLIINMKTAKALGITIPEAILQRADEVLR